MFRTISIYNIPTLDTRAGTKRDSISAHITYYVEDSIRSNGYKAFRFDGGRSKSKSLIYVQYTCILYVIKRNKWLFWLSYTLRSHFMIRPFHIQYTNAIFTPLGRTECAWGILPRITIGDFDAFKYFTIIITLFL